MMRKYHVRFGGGPMEKEHKRPRQRPTQLHESLRLRVLGIRHRWAERTPATAAGLADRHYCSMRSCGCRRIRSR